MFLMDPSIMTESNTTSTDPTVTINDLRTVLNFVALNAEYADAEK